MRIMAVDLGDARRDALRRSLDGEGMEHGTAGGADL